ncbi:hypothetical protein CLOM_g11994 [Closterium sp. NIES-68]|nr:hypothetical protein CLOM_g11994 [Closterium sp. NIES-68]GJP84576.1 hypothetical protein CLOP_g14635 [Closterium sp. NIES-67]
MAEPDVGPLVASFIDFTGSDDAVALQMLQATSWRLEEAVQLFFAGGAEAAGAQRADADGGGAVGRGGGGGTGPRDATPPPRSSSPPPAPAAATAGGGGLGMGGSMGGGEEVVRAPLPVRREALYGDAYALNRPTLGVSARALAAAAPPVVDGFRDFGGEAAARARARGEGQQGGEGGAVRQASLASLFEPPYDILFAGSFDQAKQRAGAEGKWLLVNVQSTGEFASHMLNRDVWAVPAVKETITTYFVLWQVDAAAAEGAKVCGYYGVAGLPVVMVLHPATGQRKRCWEGALSADQLLEDLMPFIDRAPQEGASLPGGEVRPPKKPRDVPEAAQGVGVVGRSGEEDEEEQLRLALAASLEGHSEGQKGEAGREEQGGGVGAGRDDALHEAEEQQGAQAGGAAAAEVEVPEEPAVGTPASCRIAIRCPDGARLQRRFLSLHPLEVLRAWCRQQLPEAAAGRPFRLSLALPGSAPLDLSSATTIADAGLANSLLALAWD